MARIRSIKPEVFFDEELWDLEQETGLPLFRAFVGLWTQADREGRFEWRPRKLKAQVMPYWDGEFSRVLDALATRAFVVKYACQGREFGVVRTFKEHQVINNRESPSKLPEPPPECFDKSYVIGTLTREGRVDDACATRDVHAQAEGKGREGKGAVACARAREEPPPPPPDPEPEPEPPDDLRDPPEDWRLVGKAFAAAEWQGSVTAHQPAFAKMASELRQRGIEPGSDRLRTLVKRWLKDRPQRHNLKPTAFLEDLQEVLGPKRRGKHDMRPPARHEDFEPDPMPDWALEGANG